MVDYNVMRKIQPPLTYLHPDLSKLNSSVPNRVFVNPGLGGIIQDYHIFVPIYSHSNPHLMKKTSSSDSTEQSGFGVLPTVLDSTNSERARDSSVYNYENALLVTPQAASQTPAATSSSATTSATLSTSSLTSSSLDSLPVVFSKNSDDTKRQRLGVQIYEQFMKPKTDNINTGKLELKNELKTKEQPSSSSLSAESKKFVARARKTSNHKFKFL